MAIRLLTWFRVFGHAVSWLVLRLLKPIKLFAFRSRFPFLKRFILAFTTPIDFSLIWLSIQNETMLLHSKAYGGNFLFGQAVMVVDHPTAAEAIVKPLSKSNDFMGVGIVAFDSCAFATNSGILNQCPPIRDSSRRYVDQAIFTPAVLEHTLESVRAASQPLLDEWSQHPAMADTFVIRTAVVRIFLKLLSGVTVPAAEAEFITRQYMRRFVELSLLSKYLPFLCELLGTHRAIRKDAYFRLKAYGIDTMTVDITLFAALFSVGTLVIRCVEDIQRFSINYTSLEPNQKRHFIIEVVRLYPTVTTVHRMVEHDEVVQVCGREVRLTGGDQVAYPFICTNRDTARFSQPESLLLDRSPEEYERVLSWSKGPHACPAKELSIQVAIAMLDTLGQKFALDQLRIFNPAF